MFALTGVSNAAPSSAVTCDATNHCRGAVDLLVTPPSGFTGVSAHLRVDHQTLVNYYTEITTQEVWIANGASWIEAGIYTGYGWTSSSDETTPHYFWAESDANGNFLRFDQTGEGAYPLNSDVSVNISESSPTSSTIYLAGFQHTATHGVVYPAVLLEAGTESNTMWANSYGSAFNLSWYDLYGGIHQYWMTQSKNANLYISPPGAPTVSCWVPGYSYWWMRSEQGGSYPC